MTRPRLRRFVVLTALALAIAWFGWWRPIGARTGPVPVALNDGWNVATPASQGIDARALDTAARRVLDGPYDVHTILVERHGVLVAEWTQGGTDQRVYAPIPVRTRITPDALHDVRSIGKSVTALLYGIALREHRVPSPDTPLSRVYPHLTGRAAANAARIRVGDLLDMASGLDWNEGDGPVNDELRLFYVRDLPAYVLDRPLRTAPGTTFNYNGGGTALLAGMIARGSGMPLDHYAASTLFAPLGIQTFEWVRDVHGRPMAFNGLRLRPRDLLKIGRLARDHGQWNGQQIVPCDWIDAAWAPGRATGVADFTYRGQWWAGRVPVRGRDVDWHAGFGNGGQRVFEIPALDLGIVTAAGAYDREDTAIAVNRLLREVAASTSP